MPKQLANTLGTLERDNLFAGGVQPVVTDSVTLKAGQVYVRGTVLGLDDDGKATIVDSASEGNQSKPYAILADDIDATDEAEVAVVYLTGEFNQDAVIFGGEDTSETHKVALREIGIFLKKTVGA